MAVPPSGEVVTLDDIDRVGAVQPVASLLNSGERWLKEAAVQQLLHCYGIKTARTTVARAPEEWSVLQQRSIRLSR
jgi:hypothetical protein